MKQVVIDEESSWPVRDTKELAVLDAIMFGRGFYQVPNEALASRDPDRSSPDKLPGDVHSDPASG